MDLYWLIGPHEPGYWRIIGLCKRNFGRMVTVQYVDWLGIE